MGISLGFGSVAGERVGIELPLTLYRRLREAVTWIKEPKISLTGSNWSCIDEFLSKLPDLAPYLATLPCFSSIF